MRYILGIDIGTTAIKAAVIGEDGKVYGEETCEYALTTLPTGEVEADLQDRKSTRLNSSHWS